MKRALIALLAGVMSSVATAQPTVVTDINGTQHFTGYLGKKKTLENGEAKRYWAPTVEDAADTPDHYDARDDKLVAPIKDQGQCGSCWDFSMTKSYESARLLAGKDYLDFAEQDVLVNDGHMYGCNGGFMDAHYYVDHGVTSETNCPYKANDGVGCKKAPVDKKALKWGFVGAEGRQPTEQELAAAVYKYKVISVTVAAGGNDWNGGNGGKMTSCRNTGVNHMVNVVGFDCRADAAKRLLNQRVGFGGGKCVFIGANSWGTSWGDAGFFYAKQGCNEFIGGADSALFIEYEADAPVPVNPPVVRTATDVSVPKGVEAPVGLKAEQGVTYKWSTGATTPLIWVKADQDATLDVTGTNKAGSTTSTVHIHVLP